MACCPTTRKNRQFIVEGPASGAGRSASSAKTLPLAVYNLAGWAGISSTVLGERARRLATAGRREPLLGATRGGVDGRRTWR